MLETISNLKFIEVAVVIFMLGVTASVVAMVCWLKGWWKKPPCPKVTCQSTDVERFTLPDDPIRLVHYRCRLCSNEWANGPTMITNE